MKPNYFIAVKSWVLQPGSPLSMKARTVALVISNHMRKAPEWTLSVGLIAKEAGTSERSAWAAVSELERAGILAVESGSMTGTKRANTYTLREPYTSVRPADSRNYCEGGEGRPSQKTSRRKARPSQKVRTTLATVANTILSQSYTDSILGEEQALKPVDLAAYVRKVADSSRLPAIPGSRCA